MERWNLGTAENYRNPKTRNDGKLLEILKDGMTENHPKVKIGRLPHSCEDVVEVCPDSSQFLNRRRRIKTQTKGSSADSFFFVTQIRNCLN